MADEQRPANIITAAAPEPNLSGEALRIEINRLQALADHEEAVRKAAEAEASPPRPFNLVVYDMLSYLAAHAGNPPLLDGLLAELKRSIGE